MHSTLPQPSCTKSIKVSTHSTNFYYAISNMFKLPSIMHVLIQLDPLISHVDYYVNSMQSKRHVIAILIASFPIVIDIWIAS
jgi:hypothetical protein